MTVKFGTSGVRGLVVEMTDQVCYLYTRAFIQYLETAAPGLDSLAVGVDLRSSSPRIRRAVMRAAADAGLNVIPCGQLPTPALAQFGISRRIPSVMVTGSHVAADRNGLKFNLPWGEVLKRDESEISRRFSELSNKDKYSSLFGPGGMFLDEAGLLAKGENPQALQEYLQRNAAFFPPGCLVGKTVVVYQHSSVSRRLVPELLRAYGARVVLEGHSDAFIAVDTEAVEEPERLADWVRQHQADALVSTDGDGDRPLVVDDRGNILRGDVLGILVSQYLGAQAVVVPLNCNTALEKTGSFSRIYRTPIGSPYVVEGMQRALDEGYSPVVGYEANGGFLLASDIAHPLTGAGLAALPTRDAALPILAVLALAGQNQIPLSALAAQLPPRYTISGLVSPFPTEQGKALVDRAQADGAAFVSEFFEGTYGPLLEQDHTDGVRFTFASGLVIHLRPSGNAPEFRVYTEASTQAQAEQVNAAVQALVAAFQAAG